MDYVGGNRENVVDMEVKENYFEMGLVGGFDVGRGGNFDMVFRGGGYLGYGVKGKGNMEIDELSVCYKSLGE